MVSFPLFVIAIIWLLYKAFSEKPCPKGYTYDMEKAQKDRESGVSAVSNLPIFEHFCHPIFDHRSIKKQPKLQFLIFDFRNVIEFSRSYSALVGGALFSSTWRLTA